MKEEVSLAGESVAVVLAEDRYLAEDAAERVRVDYEPLPVAADVREALTPDAPRAHVDAEDNLAGTLRLEYGDVDAAFAGAAHVVHRSLFQHRGGGHAMECRTLLARYDPTGESVTIWAGTQSPHHSRTCRHRRGHRERAGTLRGRGRSGAGHAGLAARPNRRRPRLNGEGERPERSCSVAG